MSFQVCRGMPFCTCYPRVGCLLDPDLCCSCVGHSSPASRRACTPDPALSHRHARLLAARRPAAVGTRWSTGHPVTPAARPGMTHRDEQSMRRRTESTHIDAPMPVKEFVWHFLVSFPGF